jgi:hypothetical protein
MMLTLLRVVTPNEFIVTIGARRKGTSSSCSFIKSQKLFPLLCRITQSDSMRSMHVIMSQTR